MTETELAWAAGFFDGEGSVSTRSRSRAGRRPEMRITISQVHPEVLERFRDAVGLGSVTGPHDYPSRTPNRQVQWRYCTYGTPQTRSVIELLWPYLSSVKRVQAERCLAAADVVTVPIA